MNHVDMWGRVFKAEGHMRKGPEADRLVWLASRSNKERGGASRQEAAVGWYRTLEGNEKTLAFPQPPGAEQKSDVI